ncbi:hypothetical protein HGRIS_004802 [Hohenbuehelia grisea]|uniref:FAD-binding domain-containing protein n=1 Tax=Hohenbuehelia grisea TaxID=104357 RepID=A0ABR3JD30_9AGAR
MADSRRPLPKENVGRRSEAEQVLKEPSTPSSGRAAFSASSSPTTNTASADLDLPSQPLIPPIRPRSASSRPTGQRFASSTAPGQDRSIWTMAATQVLGHKRSASFQRPIPVSQPFNDAEHYTNHVTERMRSINLNPRIAPLKINFIIVGGCISGLASAYALCQAGHHVQVLEKAPSLHQRAAGVRMPPNLTKILVDWGLGDKLEKLARKCNKSMLYSMETGETLGCIEWREDILKEAGGEFLLTHFNDLRQMLYDLAVSSGATVTFNATVTELSVDKEKRTPIVRLANGTQLTADVVVGADGPKGVVRKAVTGLVDDGIDTGESFYTVIVPSEALRAVPELAHFPDLPEWPIWMGDRRSGLAYAVNGGKEFCVHLYWPDNEVDFDGGNGEEWDVRCPTSAINMEGYESRMRQIINAAPDALRTKYVAYPPLEDWVDDHGCMLLIGEAAHCMLACATHNASLAVEDAVVLGSLMSRLRSREQIPMLLQAFQDIRFQRCTDTVLSELNMASLCTIPAGPERDARDAGLKAAMLEVADRDHRWTDQQLLEQWQEVGHIFGYNARDAAEDWWVNWGSIGESSDAMPVHKPLNLRFEVTETIASEPSAWTKVMG